MCKLFDLPLFRPETYHPSPTTPLSSNKNNNSNSYSQPYASNGVSNGVSGRGVGGGGSKLGSELGRSGVTIKEDDTLSLVSHSLEALENILKKSLTIKVIPLTSAPIYIPSLASPCLNIIHYPYHHILLTSFLPPHYLPLCDRKKVPMIRLYVLSWSVAPSMTLK